MGCLHRGRSALALARHQRMSVPEPPPIPLPQFAARATPARATSASANTPNSLLQIKKIGKRNKATVFKQYDLQKEFTEKSITQEKVKELIPELAKIWNPKIDCEIIPTAPYGAELKGAHLGDCAAAAGKI